MGSEEVNRGTNKPKKKQKQTKTPNKTKPNNQKKTATKEATWLE